MTSPIETQAPAPGAGAWPSEWWNRLPGNTALPHGRVIASGIAAVGRAIEHPEHSPSPARRGTSRGRQCASHDPRRDENPLAWKPPAVEAATAVEAAAAVCSGGRGLAGTQSLSPRMAAVTRPCRGWAKCKRSEPEAGDAADADPIHADLLLYVGRR